MGLHLFLIYQNHKWKIEEVEIGTSLKCNGKLVDGGRSRDPKLEFKWTVTLNEEEKRTFVKTGEIDKKASVWLDVAREDETLWSSIFKSGKGRVTLAGQRNNSTLELKLEPLGDEDSSRFNGRRNQSTFDCSFEGLDKRINSDAEFFEGLVKKLDNGQWWFGSLKSLDTKISLESCPFKRVEKETECTLKVLTNSL